MAQHYTPIWDDWFEVTQELNAQEKGRLIDAIVAYDNGGDWQEQIKGNERYVFPGYRARIDRWKETCDSRAENRKTKENKAEQNITKITNDNKTHKDNDKDNDKVIKSISQRTHDTERLFDKFWSVYPRHEGKQAAQKAFDKLKPDEALLETMISAILKQKGSAQWQESRFIPHPATWLNGHRWEDEPVKDTGGKRLLAQQYEQREYNNAEMEELLGVHDLFKEEAI